MLDIEVIPTWVLVGHQLLYCLRIEIEIMYLHIIEERVIVAYLQYGLSSYYMPNAIIKINWVYIRNTVSFLLILQRERYVELKNRLLYKLNYASYKYGWRDSSHMILHTFICKLQLVNINTNRHELTKSTKSHNKTMS